MPEPLIAKAFLSKMDETRPADDAGAATPADRRRVRRKNLLVFSLFLLVVLSALLSTVLFVNNGRNYKRLVRQYGLEHYLLPPPETPKLRIDRLKRLSPSGRYPVRLLLPGVQPVGRFEAAPTADAEERCEALRTPATTELTYTPNGRDWECLAFEEFGTGSDRASLFLQSKGSEADTIRTFRLKLSFTDASQSTAVIEAAMASIDHFDLSLTPQSRAYIAEKLGTQEKFSSLLENYKASLTREYLDGRRFNLLLLPRTQSVSCETTLPPAKARAITYALTIACLDVRSRIRTEASVTPDPTLPGPDHPPVPSLRPEPDSSGG